MHIFWAAPVDVLLFYGLFQFVLNFKEAKLIKFAQIHKYQPKRGSEGEKKKEMEGKRELRTEASL